VVNMGEAEKGNGKKIIFTILFVIIFTACLVFCLTSDMFKVRKIEVKNASNLDIDKIKTDSGIVEGRNIFLQRYFKGMFKLKENARIQDVKIYPVFPDKIEIYVEERNENYQISDENGYYIIDKNGYILRKSDELQKIIMLLGLKTTSLSDKKRIDREDLDILEKINKIKYVLDYYELTNKVTSIEKKDRQFILDLKDEKKKIVLKEELTELRAQISISKHIIETEKGKEGEIFNDKNQKRNYMVFREKI
jgi:POTRA domain-containing protein, ftsQ-type